MVDLDDNDDFSRVSLAEWVQTGRLKRKTAIQFLNELKEMPDLSPTWDNALQGIPDDLAEDVIKNWIESLSKKRTMRQDWWLMVGSFITW